MKKKNIIQNQLTNEINRVEKDINKLNLLCSIDKNPDIIGAFNEIENDIQILRHARLDSYEYNKLSDFLTQLDNISTHVALKDIDELEEFKTTINVIKSTILSLKRYLYFSSHLSSALEQINVTSHATKRNLIMNVGIIGQTILDNLDDRLRKQYKIVIDTYYKIRMLHSLTQKNILPDETKLADALENFIINEMNIEVPHEITAETKWPDLFIEVKIKD